VIGYDGKIDTLNCWNIHGVWDKDPVEWSGFQVGGIAYRDRVTLTVVKRKSNGRHKVAEAKGKNRVEGSRRENGGYTARAGWLEL